ncbi:MAG: hypothetical protein ACYS7Y_26975 [Planctomycetota bacterium]|jgi:hypothetical protein
MNVKESATIDRLRALGAKVRIIHRKLAHREKSYLRVKSAGGLYEFNNIVMPAICKDFPDAYMTSGVWASEGTEHVIALEK